MITNKKIIAFFTMFALLWQLWIPLTTVSAESKEEITTRIEVNCKKGENWNNPELMFERNLEKQTDNNYLWRWTNYSNVYCSTEEKLTYIFNKPITKVKKSGFYKDDDNGYKWSKLYTEGDINEILANSDLEGTATSYLLLGSTGGNVTFNFKSRFDKNNPTGVFKLVGDSFEFDALNTASSTVQYGTPLRQKYSVNDDNNGVDIQVKIVLNGIEKILYHEYKGDSKTFSYDSDNVPLENYFEESELPTALPFNIKLITTIKDQANNKITNTHTVTITEVSKQKLKDALASLLERMNNPKTIKNNNQYVNALALYNQVFDDVNKWTFMFYTDENLDPIIKEVIKRRDALLMDNGWPVITFPYNSNTDFFVGETYNFLQGVRAIDEVDGEIAEKQFVWTAPTANQVGELTIKVRAEDKNWNEGVGQVTINIKENSNEKNALRLVKEQAEQELALINVVANLNKENLTNKIKEANTLLLNVNATKTEINDMKIALTWLIALLVKDNEAPKITGIANKTITVGEVFNAKEWVTITDNYDPSPTYTVVWSCLADSVKTCELTYKTQDKYGNKRDYKRTITVIKNGSKIDQLKAELKIAKEHIQDKKSVKDNAYNNLQITIWKANTLLENEDTASATDIQNLIIEFQTNNAAIKKDNEWPVITVWYNPTNDFFVGEVSNLLNKVTAEDDIEGNVNSSLRLKEGNVNFNVVGNYPIVIEAKDSKENITEKNITITINENTKEKKDLLDAKKDADTKIADIHSVHNEDYHSLVEKIKSAKEAIENVNSSKVSLKTLTNALTTNLAKIISDTEAPVLSNLNIIELGVGESYNLNHNVWITDNYDNNPTYTIEGDYSFDKSWIYIINYIGRDKHGNVSKPYPRTLKISPNLELINKLTKLLVEWRGLKDNPNLIENPSSEALKKLIKDWENLLKDQTTAKKGDLENTIRELENTIPKIVIDNIPPVITFPYTEDTTFFVGEEYNFLKWIKAIDNIDWDVSETITPETSLPNLKAAGEYTLRVSALDKKWNKSEKTIKITIKEANELKVALSNLKNKALQLLNDPKVLKNKDKENLEKAAKKVEELLKKPNLPKNEIEKNIEELKDLTWKIKKDIFLPLININKKSETFPVWTVFTEKDKLSWITLEDDNPVLTPEILLKRLVYNDNINGNKVWTYHISYTVHDDNQNVSNATKEVIIVPNDKKELKNALENLDKLKNVNVGQKIKDQINDLKNNGDKIVKDDNASVPTINKMTKDINDFIAKFDTDYPPAKINVKNEKIISYVWQKIDIKWNATAIDPNDWDITNKIEYTIMGNSDITKKWVWTILYSVENSKGRVTTKLIEFEIKEKELPPFDPDAYYRDLYTNNNNSGWSSGWGWWGRGGSYRPIWEAKGTNESQPENDKKEEKKELPLKPEKIKEILILLSQENIKQNSNEPKKTIQQPEIKNTTKQPINPNSFKETEDYNAYNYALNNKIITEDYFKQDKMYQPITRGELGVIVANYSKNVLKRKPHIPFSKCLTFKDLKTEGNVIIKDGMVSSCTYGLMWMQPDWINQIPYFNPNEELTRKDLGTVLSRMLYWIKYDDVSLGKEYYKKHLANLQEKGIIKVNNPELKELRIWVLLMIERYSKLMK